MLANQALDKFLTLVPKGSTVLDIGSGSGEHAQILQDNGYLISTLDLCNETAHIKDDYLKVRLLPYDAIWCSHVLEHQRNPGLWLDKIKKDLKPGGWLALTVPPYREWKMPDGHILMWREDVLIYNMILAGFDCHDARVGVYDYNISAIVQNKDFDMPAITTGQGDLELLKNYFPWVIDRVNVQNPNLGSINW